MTREEAIAVPIDVTRIGQRISFQVILPKDTSRIIGVECSGLVTFSILLDGCEDPGIPNPLRMVSGKTIGLLTLRVAGAENIFYQDEIKEDRNVHFGEVIASTLWVPRIRVYGRKRQETQISVSGDATLIEGYFIDSWGVNEYSSLNYQLHLYIWIEKTVCA